MDSEIPLWGRLTRAVALRVMVVCVLATLLIQLLAHTHLYATALILVGLCALVVHDLSRLMSRAQREVGSQGISAPPSREARQREQQLQYTEALLDTVTAALFVVREDGTAAPANRSARRLAGQSFSRLAEVPALGSATADLLQSMPPGARHVVHLSDGQPVYVSATEFRGAGDGKQRLLSLQRIAGELDGVELKAWQDVARVLTHEMMNSLTPIASLSENLERLLREAQLTEPVAATELSGALEAIKRRSHGLMNFVERYRAVAELPEPKLRAVDWEQLFVGIDQLMRTTLREAGVTYQRRMMSSPPTMLADPELLEQAIINLIRNAAEAASEADAPVVSVVCEMREQEWIIAVADNGPGLNEQQREKLFVPFYSTKPDGSGIGLSLARQIAFAH
ncbi:sensor histidine kinase, partial [Steroidobacter sp.]|uniref:sensor histidine kinase n=1 Tax=Steroidobacter sp. TaxID=1978227 RepID=UPI001A4578A1